MSEGPASSSARTIEYLILLTILVLLAVVAADWCLGERVERSFPAGTVQRVTSAGGLRGRLLVETESAYYPVYKPIAVQKGAALVLQERGNGDWYLCDGRTQLCARTSGKVLKNVATRGAP